jgi:nucleoid DNA-binding protein
MTAIIRNRLLHLSFEISAAAMATVTKKDIVNRLSDNLGITQSASGQALDALIEIISASLMEGDDVALRMFGTFELRLTKGKLGRNPSQPEIPVQIPPRFVVRFKPGRELKDRIASLPVLSND